MLKIIEKRILEKRSEVEKIKDFNKYLKQIDSLDQNAMASKVASSINEGVNLMFEYEEVSEDMQLIGFVAQCDSEMNCAEFYWGNGEDDEFYEMGPVRGGFQDPGYGVLLAAAKESFDGDDDSIEIINDYMWTLLTKVFHLAIADVVNSKKFKSLPIQKPFKVYLCEHDGWGSDFAEKGLVLKLD